MTITSFRFLLVGMVLGHVAFRVWLWLMNEPASSAMNVLGMLAALAAVYCVFVFVRDGRL